MHRDNRLLLVISLTFIVTVVSCLLYSPQTQRPKISSLPAKEAVLGMEAPMEKRIIPVFQSVSEKPFLSAESIYAVDLETESVLFEKASEIPLLPASTAKIVTALVALDYYSPGTILTVPAFSVDGQKMGLFAGETISVTDLLYGLLVYSANDAAEVLARNFPGGRDAFILAMNLKAEEAQLTLTNFVHPAGLDQNNQYTTSRDLVKVSKFALKNPLFAQIVATKYYHTETMGGKFVYDFKNINELLFEDEGIKGVKTGWTENAKENLVTYYEKDGKKLLIALLRSNDRFGETKQVLNWILQNYTWEEKIAESI